MSEVLAEQTWQSSGLTDNPYFAKKKWLQRFQDQQWQVFKQRGLPKRREEAWKYTDVSSLEKRTFNFPEKEHHAIYVPENLQDNRQLDVVLFVFVNGYFSKQLSNTALLPPDVTLCPLSEALISHEQLIKPYLLQMFDVERYPFACLNAALMTDGMFLFIPKNIILAPPIHLLFLSAQQNNFMTSPRNIIVAEENCAVTLLEEYAASSAENYFTNTTTQIYAQKNAQIAFHKIQNEGATAVHIANNFVEQQQDSHVSTCSLTVGSQLAREDVTIHLKERGAKCDLSGFYCLNYEGQHIDNHVHVDHLAEHGESDICYKGILDKKSCAVFNGKVYVHENAQHTNAHQENHSLLLSAFAEVYTKPELEIYTDDVKCTHGATVGQLDTEALFYLCSRGIAKDIALKLLTFAFAADVMDRVSHPVLAVQLNNVLNQKLSLITQESE